jgi:hypothetical protein
MLASRVTVTSGSWAVWGYNVFGLSPAPFIFGISLKVTGDHSGNSKIKESSAL